MQEPVGTPHETPGRAGAPRDATRDQVGPPVPLGEAVRAAREAAGMTVEQVSARTKIRAVVLRDLEQGSTARSGGDVYARGHLKAVAAATGTDPSVLLAAHERTLAPGPAEDGARTADARPAGAPLVGAPPAGARPAGARPARARLARARLDRAGAQQGRAPALSLPTPARERGGPRWGTALVAATGVLAVLLLAGTWTQDDPPSAGQVLGVAAPSQPTAAAPPAPAAAPAAPAAPGTALRLEVGSGSSWVQVVTATGEELFQGELPAGTAREFTDTQPLQVVVGNAAAVTVACAGTDSEPGRRGQVRRWTCAPDGLVPA